MKGQNKKKENVFKSIQINVDVAQDWTSWVYYFMFYFIYLFNYLLLDCVLLFAVSDGCQAGFCCVTQ